MIGDKSACLRCQAGLKPRTLEDVKCHGCVSFNWREKQESDTRAENLKLRHKKR